MEKTLKNAHMTKQKVTMQSRNSPLRSSLCNGLICPLSIKLITGDFRDSRTLKVMLHGTIRNDNF